MVRQGGEHIALLLFQVCRRQVVEYKVHFVQNVGVRRWHHLLLRHERVDISRGPKRAASRFCVSIFTFVLVKQVKSTTLVVAPSALPPAAASVFFYLYPCTSKTSQVSTWLPIPRTTSAAPWHFAYPTTWHSACRPQPHCAAY